MNKKLAKTIKTIYIFSTACLALTPRCLTDEVKDSDGEYQLPQLIPHLIPHSFHAPHQAALPPSRNRRQLKYDANFIWPCTS